MHGGGIVEWFHFNAPAVVRVMVPIEKHRAHRRQQCIRDGPRGSLAVVRTFGLQAAENRDSCAQHVHRVSRGGKQFQGLFELLGQSAQRSQPCLIGGKFRGIGKLAMHQQVGHFLIVAVRGEVPDIVAAIVQIVAALSDGADGRRSSGSTGEDYGFFGFEDRREVAGLRFDHQGLR